MIPYPSLFSAGQIRGLEIRNRVMMAPMESNMAAPGGIVSDSMLAYYQARAQGGVGMVIVEYACVDQPAGLGGSPQLAIDDDALIPSHRRLANAIKTSGARACVQLFHAGRQTLRKYTDGVQSVAASAIACKVYRELPRELEVDEIALIVQRFAEAAARAAEAGYDAVEIHGAHGYLVGGFLSGASNHRVDEYGGLLANRLRFPAQIVSAVRKTAGTMPVIFRFSAEEFVEGGTTIDEACWFAPRLVAAGADALHVSTGTAERLDRNVDPVSAPQGWRVPLARRIREITGAPVITVGVIRDPAVAEAAIADGSADFVALGRALLADPEWANKAHQGRADTIRPCTSCNWCVDQLLQGKRLGCAENPLAGRESEPTIQRSGSSRAVVVVGGGPGGLASALLLEAAGFKVTLFEKEAVLASGLIASGAPPDKEKFEWYRSYLLSRVSQSNIEVRLGRPATSENIAGLKPVATFVATGAVDRTLDIPGVEYSHVSFAYDVLSGKSPLGEGPVLIFGTGETGCEMAEYAAKAGRDVVLVSRSADRRLARRAQYIYRRQLIARLECHPRIRIASGLSLANIGLDMVTLIDQAGATQVLPVKRVLLAAGRLPSLQLADELNGIGIPVFGIGDAREVRRIGDAVHDAYREVVALAGRNPATDAFPQGFLPC
jgi:2,4-dienoyl-CoA reductase-like NADH-dependent reductase (Old Yellow Enzyme family)/thioredoxin reductase